jgi:hypothetical protein
MENLDTQNMQFTLQMRFQIRYKDHRLIFNKVAFNENQPITGGEDLKQRLWMPHLFFVNEKFVTTHYDSAAVTKDHYFLGAQAFWGRRAKMSSRRFILMEQF